MKNNDLPRDAVRFPSVNDSIDRHGNGYRRRDFLKIIGTAAGAAGLVSVGVSVAPEKAQAFAYEPYYTDDQLTTVVTSCAHNCGSRHVLVAHKKGDVIVHLSTDNGEYQAGGAYGKDTLEEPQLRACLRGRSYRARLYSPERLLYPMKRVGARGEHKFKRITWDEALNEIAQKMVQLKKDFGPTAILDQSYAGASYGVLHKSDQIEGLLGRFLGMFGCRTNSWSVPSYQGTTFSSRMTFGTIQDGNEDDAFAHSKLIITWGWNPAYEIPYIPKWIEPFESLNHPITKDYPFHLISPHPRWRTHSTFNNIPWLRETYEQEVTINASDAKKLGILTGDTVEVWNERGKCVVPAYVTERLLPGVLVLFEGAWMDPDKDGVERAGNPDFLTLDNPSPAGAFAYNNAMVQIRKTDLVHRPGWDDLAVARSSVFRRDM